MSLGWIWKESKEFQQNITNLVLNLAEIDRIITRKTTQLYLNFKSDFKLFKFHLKILLNDLLNSSTLMIYPQINHRSYPLRIESNLTLILSFQMLRVIWIEYLLHELHHQLMRMILCLIYLKEVLISTLNQPLFSHLYESLDHYNLWNLREVGMKFWVDIEIREEGLSLSHRTELNLDQYLNHKIENLNRMWNKRQGR